MKIHNWGGGFIILSIFCISVYFIFYNNAAQKLEEAKVITPSTTLSVVIPKPKISFLDSTKPSISTYLQNQPTGSVIGNIQLLDNENIITAAKVFWTKCKRHNNCEAQLKKLQNQLNEEKYNIIKEYPQKISEFNDILQEEITSSNQPLEQKIETIKNAYNTLWGDLAEELFVDELEYYEQRLALNALYSASQYLNLDEKTQLFNEWVNTQTADNHLNNYRAAQLFFSKEISANPDFAITIAKKYLTAEQATQEKNHLQRQYHQKNQAKNYQQSLLQLNKKLKDEREGSHNNLNEADWLEYKTQRVYEFRERFFK